MKISHICPFVGEQMGGSERYVWNISKMQSEEHDVHIYTTTLHPQRVGTSKSDGVTYHRFYSPLVIWNVNPLCIILRSLLHSGTDIFHVHSYLYTLSNQAVLAKLVMNNKALLQLHGGVGLPPYKTSWTKIAAKRLYDTSLGRFTIEHSDLVASVSYGDLDVIATHFSVPESQLRYVPNAVDTSIFRPRMKRDTSERILLYVGDLEPWKGVASLMEWIDDQDQWDGGPLTIRFVGQGSLFSRLRKMQYELQKNQRDIRIEALGSKNHDEIPALMRDADALILPSYWEGMPTVVLEAMASGTVAVCTPVGDIPKVIEHLNTGLLISRSSIDFQKALSTVLFDMKKVKRITENARKLVEQEFSLDKVTSILNGLYLELME